MGATTLAVLTATPSATGIWIMAAIIATGVGIAGLILHAGPKGEEAIQLAQSATESWKNNYQAVKVDLEKTRADADARFREREAEKERAHALEVALSAEKARPSVDQIAAVLSEMSSNFDRHRNDLVNLIDQQNKRGEKIEESLGSMHQALILLVDRNRANRGNDPKEASK